MSAIKPAKAPAVPMRSDDAALLIVGDALVPVATTVTVVLPEVPLLPAGRLVEGTEVVVLDGLPLDALGTTAVVLDAPDTLDMLDTLGVETPMTDLVLVGELRL